MRLFTFERGDIIDLDQVQRIGTEGGDTDWIRFCVHFSGGTSIEVYTKRPDCLRCGRDEFIAAWKGTTGQ